MKKLLYTNPQSKKTKIATWSILTIASVSLIGLVLVKEMDFSSNIKGFETITNKIIVQTLHSDTLLPPPLRSVFGGVSDPLTDAGVLTWTNQNRSDAGLKDLVLNETLSKMAGIKLQDLFDKQYFEHVSPTGIGPGELAKQIGYDYIVIGENLALGSFNGDKALLEAWMASPGHRANILNVRYREIGIAVGQGVFEGKTVWIAVQEFGLPIAACTQPSSTDKTAVNKMKSTVDALEASLTTQKSVIDTMPVKYGPDYSAKVDTYNTSVHKFNDLVITLKAKIADYNKQVTTFNNCAEAVNGTTTPKL